MNKILERKKKRNLYGYKSVFLNERGDLTKI